MRSYNGGFALKRIGMTLVVLLLLGCLTACSSDGSSSASSETETAVSETEISASETEFSAFETEVSDPETEISVSGVNAAESEMDILPDFTVKTIDGSDFTLSEALKDHDLVVINLFATWCSYCEIEFPYLQEAWSQCADKVAVIALSIEPDDSEEDLLDYAEENSLTLPIGREEGTDLSRFANEGVPVTILVDKTGRVAAVELGAKVSTQEFLDLFNRYRSEN